MKKIIGILSGTSLVLAMFFNTSLMKNNNTKQSFGLNEALAKTCAESEAAHEADLNCPEWKIKVTIGFPTNTIECNDGGSKKCGVSV